MKWFLRIAAALVVLLAAAAAAIYLTGNTLAVLVWVGQPRHGWDMAYKALAPDYAKADAWAALPSKPSEADLVPAGVAPPPKGSGVDVFFVHPTGYLNGADWNSPLDPNSKTEENTKWMLANQASAFNGCCNVY